MGAWGLADMARESATRTWRLNGLAPHAQTAAVSCSRLLGGVRAGRRVTNEAAKRRCTRERRHAGQHHREDVDECPDCIEARPAPDELGVCGMPVTRPEEPRH